MQLVLSEKYTRERQGKVYLRNFYLARYTRLMPTYLIVLAATWIFTTNFNPVSTDYAINPNEMMNHVLGLPDSIRNTMLKVYMVFTNIFIFFQDLIINLGVLQDQVVFSLLRPKSDFYLPKALYIPQAWSLGVEIAFYALAPLMFKLKDKGLTLLTLGLFTFKLGFIMLGPESDLYFRTFPFEICYFLLGALLYRKKDCLNFFDGTKHTLLLHFVAYALVCTVSLLLPPIKMNWSVLYVLAVALLLPAVFLQTKRNSVRPLHR